MFAKLSSRDTLNLRSLQQALPHPSQHTDEFINPNINAKPTTLPPESDGEKYLEINKKNNLAEYAAFLKKIDLKALENLDVEDYEDGEFVFITGIRREDGTQVKDFKNYHNHLFLFKSKLCSITFHRDQPKLLRVKVGVRSNGILKDPYNNQKCYDLGFIGGYMDVHSACSSLSPQLPLLQCVARPSTRIEVDCRSPKSNSDVPINAIQRSTINNLKYNIECIQGPPGTGKSTTIFHLINEENPDIVVLATCVQNKAVDAIADKLKGNIPFIVSGNEERLGLEAKEWTLENQIKRDDEVVDISVFILFLEFNYTRLRSMIQKKEELMGSPAPFLDNAVAPKKRTGKMLWRTFWLLHLEQRYKKIYQLQKHLSQCIHSGHICKAHYIKQARERIVTSSRAILCTVMSVGSLMRDAELCEATSQIKTVILDEAGTVPESKLPVLLRLSSLERIIAIGDQKQLAPYSDLDLDGNKCYGYARGYCRFGINCKFSHSNVTMDGFFQRVEKTLQHVPTLTHQYRMHANIAKKVSDLFYCGNLITPSEVQTARQMADEEGIYFLNVRGSESTPKYSKSKQNEDEALALIDYYRENLFMLRNKKEVMIITFYKGQERLLSRQFKEAGFLERPGVLRICTVDQSQGSEADIVLLSTVRTVRNIGFLSNPNRMNVGISRARECMVLFGSRVALEFDERWSRFLQDVKEPSTCRRKLSW